MEFLFRDLPDRAIGRIFELFTFKETVELRLVNKWFDSTCSRILNEAFLNVKTDLEAEICALGDLYKSREQTCNAQMRYKILQMMRSEIATLYVVCERYIEADVYTFSGGTILDSFHAIMSGNFDLSEASNPFESQPAATLFLMCEEFSDYFELVIEPRILKDTFYPWYGSKIMDLLDLYLNSNYHVTATYHRDTCKISGRYEILNPECLGELKLNELDSEEENLRLVCRYVRNQMRWHNFFYYVDATYETMGLNKKKDRKYNKFCLNLDDVLDGVGIDDKDGSDGSKFTKTFSRRFGNPCSKQNVSFALELRCCKDFMPCRLKAYTPGFSADDDNRSASENNLDVLSNHRLYTAESARTYDFLFTLKFVLPSDEKDCANESLLELYHSYRNCEVTQKFKQIPL